METGPCSEKFYFMQGLVGRMQELLFGMQNEDEHTKEYKSMLKVVIHCPLLFAHVFSL